MGPVIVQVQATLPLLSTTCAIVSDRLVIPAGRTTVATFARPTTYPTRVDANVVQR